MTTRTRKTWKPNAKGYYERQIGWKRTKNGNLQQHKFLLGTDLRDAQRRERKLRELWDEFANAQDESRPIWPDGLLEIAKRVAKGQAEIAIPRQADEMQATYAARIRRMQLRYPVICFIPADTHAFEVGQEALRLFEAMDLSEDVTDVVSARAVDVDVAEAWRAAHAILEHAGLDVGSKGFQQLQRSAGDEERKKKQSNEIAVNNGSISPPASATKLIATSSPQSPIIGSLHTAIRAYQEHVKKQWHRPELGQITPWGCAQVRQLDTLMEHHTNVPLAGLNYDAVEEMFGYWRQRPLRRKSDVPITRKSASNYISQLNRFFSWLHTCSRFAWRKPEDYNEISVKVVELPSDRARNLEQVDTFSLDELVLLMRYGQPMDRLLLLLGLNCGFGAAEISTLQVDEVCLHAAHMARYQEILDYKTTDADSFVKRVRRKNGVYGEFALFPLTVQGIEWALQRRRQQAGFGPQSRLLLNENGEAFDKPTRSGNRNQQIPNYFDRLVKRIEDDENVIHRLSFGKLRKTAGDLIRRFSDGEVMAVFHCRGRAVRTDDLADVYSNRPFGKVFRAIRKVEQYLRPVFEAAGPRPFDPQPQAYTRRKTIDRILQLSGEGRSVAEIAAAVDVSSDSVQRQIKRQSRKHTTDQPWTDGEG